MKNILRAITLISGLALAGCSTTLQNMGLPIGDSEPSLNPKLIPPSGKPFLTLQAKGDQVFRCTVDAQGGYYKFERPEADLYDSSGQKVATLSGPMSAIEYNDGSALISTRVKVWANASDPKKDLVLALMSAVPNGKPGVLQGVRYVQRLNSKGGLPQSVCTAPNSGKLLKVPFRAEYVFWK